MSTFSPVTNENVKTTILSAASKHCDLDPMPTYLLKNCLEELLPCITNIINASLCTGVVPEIFKVALVKPLLKKNGLDTEILKNYRPISNLQFLSKILEKVVLKQLVFHIEKNNLSETFQSAYRPNHSTETALLRVVNDLLSIIDNGSVSSLNLLDLSAAFDTIDHEILLKRLEATYGISGTALKWFRSYLHERKQIVVVENKRSKEYLLPYGVPQGSVLGPALFVLYIGPLSDVFRRNNFCYHQYADDVQLYHPGMSVSQVQTIIKETEEIITTTQRWMKQNKLILNEEKTEILIIGSKRRLASLEGLKLSLGENIISPTQNVKNLGTFLDSCLSMESQISSLYRSLIIDLKKNKYLKAIYITGGYKKINNISYVLQT